MKKVLSALCGILLFAASSIPFASCTKAENEETTEISELRFDIQVVNESNPDTKAVKTDWEVGDKILVFFNVTTQGGASYPTGYLGNSWHVVLTYDGSQWNGTFMGSSNSEDYKRLGSAGTMYAVYFPFGNVSYSVSTGFSSSGHTNSALNGKIYSYYLSDETGSPYTMTYGNIATLSGTLHMTLPANFVYFYIDKQGDNFNENDKYRLSVQGVKPATVLGWTNGVFSKEELGSGKPMWGYKYGDGIAFAGITDGTWDVTDEHTFIFFSDGDPALTRDIIGKLPSHSSVKLKNPFDAGNGWTRAMTAPTYTLMGAGGLKWGDWNLGANGLNEYGTPFRWGEIVVYSGTCDERYATHNLVGNYAIFDAARAYLGKDWRMPTAAEMDSMRNGSAQSGPSSGDVTGGHFTEKGIKCVSNSSPQNSILFPTSNGSNGSYWTSTANNGNSAPYYWLGSTSLMWASSYAISNACAVRPIYIGE